MTDGWGGGHKQAEDGTVDAETNEVMEGRAICKFLLRVRTVVIHHEHLLYDVTRKTIQFLIFVKRNFTAALMFERVPSLEIINVKEKRLWQPK